MLFSKNLFMKLREELTFLERKERVVIYCKFWKDMHTFEIASVVHVSKCRVDRLLYEALMKLRKNLVKSKKQNKNAAELWKENTL